VAPPRAGEVLVQAENQRGELQLDELVSARYRLEDITAGYDDLARGRNARGLIDFTAPYSGS